LASNKIQPTKRVRHDNRTGRWECGQKNFVLLDCLLLTIFSPYVLATDGFQRSYHNGIQVWTYL
jgi:hypothetical protein